MKSSRHRALKTASLAQIADELDDLAQRAGRTLDAHDDGDAEATLAILSTRVAEIAKERSA